MKGLSRFILVIGIAAGWFVLTADSLLAKDTLYHEYEYDASAEPVMSLALRRIFHRDEPFLVALVNGDYAKWEMEEQTKKEAEEQVNAEAEKEEQANIETENEEQANAEAVSENNNESQETDGQDNDGVDAQDSGETSTDAENNNDSGQQDVADAQIPDEAQPEPCVMAEVPDDYFADALFIGDSRTVGLSEYCEQLVDVAEFYAKISLSIYDFNKKEFVEVPIKQEEDAPDESDDTQNQEDIPTEKVTIEEALTRRKFGKVYIMLGLNELGTGTVESFCKYYGDVISRIRELQPEATIYVQGIMHVTAKKSDHDKMFKNSTIDERNEGLKGLADNQHVFYIDMNEATDDENGNLAEDLSFDDIHLKAKSYALWYDYLKTHAYVTESEYMKITANDNINEIEKQAE